MFREGWDYTNDGIRLDVCEFIDKTPEDRFRVLDVGCASGKTLKFLRQKYPFAKLFGIEPDKNNVDEAREQCEVYCESVEDFISAPEVDYDFKGYFDYILFSDVVEHLKDPWVVMRDIRQFLKEGGSLIACVPNVAFVEVLYNLIKGRFCYGTEGIVNKEHLRFFTLYEIVDMFEVCGYTDIQYAKNNLGNMSDDIKDIIDKLESMFGTNPMQHYDAYQYVVKGTK